MGWLEDWVLAAYLASTFLYYWNVIPFGPLLNAIFFVFLSFLSFLKWKHGDLWSSAPGLLALSIALFAYVTLGQFVRGDLSMSGVNRTVAWAILPLFLFVYSQRRPIVRRRFPILFVLFVSVAINVGITILAAGHIDRGKFELVAQGIDISSNEISFHYILYVVSFLVFLTRSASVFWGGLLLSLIHLSKSHILLAVASIGFVLARRLFIVLLCGIPVMGWLLVRYSEAISAAISDVNAQVIGKILKYLLFAAGMLLGEEAIPASDVAKAFGMHRLEIYQTVGRVILEYPLFGTPGAYLSEQLDRFDAHSSLFYVAASFGVPVAIGYYALLVGSCYMLATRITASSKQQQTMQNIFLIVVCYAVTRTLFMTFDVVRLFILLFVVGSLYAGRPAEGPR